MTNDKIKDVEETKDEELEYEASSEQEQRMDDEKKNVPGYTKRKAKYVTIS